jgi:ATP-dependent RNA helicase RhlB
VFCNRKDETRRLAELLVRYEINCAILSGDVRQHKRVRTLENFKAGKIRVLVATDVAGRGLHIEGMDHVINYTLPRDPEDYVHRIGRTGRAGAAGTSISFADEGDSFFIPAIETLLGNQLQCIHPQEEWLAPLPPAPKPKPRSKQRSRRPQGPRGAKGRPQGNRGQRSQGNRGRRPRRPRKPNTRHKTDAAP